MNAALVGSCHLGHLSHLPFPRRVDENLNLLKMAEPQAVYAQDEVRCLLTVFDDELTI